MRKKGKLTSFITSVLALALFIGLAVSLIKFVTKPSGMYVQYGELTLDKNNNGITLDLADGETFLFTVKNEDWGVYSAEDCKVKVVPNSEADVTFTYELQNGDKYDFSRNEDLTVAFVEQGKNKIEVDENGSFELTLSEDFSMAKVLESLHGGVLKKYYKEVNVSETPYFVIDVTSPDGSEVIRIPFLVKGLSQASQDEDAADNVAPVITVHGTYKTKYLVGDTISIFPATVTDNVTEDMTYTVYAIESMLTRMITDTYTFSSAGKYMIRYEAMDDAGNIATRDFKITVEIPGNSDVEDMPSPLPDDDDDVEDMPSPLPDDDDDDDIVHI